MHLKQTNKQKKNKKSGGLYNTFHETLSEERQLRDPDLTHYKFHDLKPNQFLQHPILWVVLNIGTKHKRYFEGKAELNSKSNSKSN